MCRLQTQTYVPTSSGVLPAGTREYATRRVVMPIVNSSPVRRRTAVTFPPLTRVPLLDFSSSTHSFPSRSTSRQWIRLAQLSWTRISASSPRPMVAGSAESVTSSTVETASVQERRIDIGGTVWGRSSGSRERGDDNEGSGMSSIVRRRVLIAAQCNRKHPLAGLYCYEVSPFEEFETVTTVRCRTITQKALPVRQSFSFSGQS